MLYSSNNEKSLLLLFKMVKKDLRNIYFKRRFVLNDEIFIKIEAI